MSTDNTTIDGGDDTNLDDFSAEFFGQNKAEPEQTNSESEEESVEEHDTDAPNEEENDVTDDSEEEDTSNDADDTEESSEDEEEDDNEEPAPQPKKKNRFQERIDELTNARREAEREAEALRQRLEAIESKLNNPEDTKPKPTNNEQSSDGPTPPKATDLDEHGEEKYPLGEFDPQYISDLTAFNVRQTLAAERAKAQQEESQKKAMEERAAVEAQWGTQLESARSRYSDFDDKGQALGSMLTNVDPAYGEYLSDTIMSMENGADVFYYLASHPEEAVQIVNSGARKATIALGRLEAQLAPSTGSSTSSRKASKAPPPPPTNKGSAVAKGRVAPDTDDLDAFERTYFSKK